MSIFKDFLDVTRDLGQAGSDTADGILKRKRYSSISKRSMEGTLQFPVIASKSLDIDTLQMVGKALERNYASFVQIAMTMSPGFDYQADKDLNGYIRKFHQNSNVKAGIDDLHNTLVTVGEGYNVVTNDDLGIGVMYGVSEGVCGPINKSNREQLSSPLEGIVEASLASKFNPTSKRLVVSKDQDFSSYHNVVEAEWHGKLNAPNHKSYKKPAGPASPFDKQETKIVVNNNNSGSGSNKEVSQKAPEYSLPTQVLKDNDAKKANELVPTIMHMRVKAITKEGDVGETIDFLLGIKTTLHPVSSEEMTTNIYTGLRNKGKFFNFIRFTTGEIGFFKDFLLNLKDIRGDIAQQSNGSSRWWLALKRRRNLAKIGDRLMLPKKFLPNASLVLSYDEAEYLKSSLGIDVMDMAVADKLMSTYFLLSLVVVDNSSQIVHFLFDGQNDYESVSFSGLEKSTHGKNDMDFKDVLRLVQRV